MKAAIKITFAAVAAVLYILAAYTVLLGAINTPMFEPNDAHAYLLDTVGAAVVAFIAAMVGIALKGGGGRAGVVAAMGESKWGPLALGVLAGVYLTAGLGFVLLWAKPDFIAGDPTPAPEYIATQAKAFVGVTLAALAGLGPSAS